MDATRVNPLFEGQYFRVVETTRIRGKRAKTYTPEYHIEKMWNGKWTRMHKYAAYLPDNTDVAAANKLASSYEGYEHHRETVEHQVDWNDHSEATLEYRREVDRFYNSLPADQRAMIDYIVKDAEERVTAIHEQTAPVW